MTRASLREYAAVQRERYRHATRAEKRQLLNEVVAVTGIHRKAAIRLLRRAPRPRATPGPGGRPRAYGPDVATAAEVLWQASGRIGAHRLHPFVPERLDRLLRCGELTLPPAVDKLVRPASRPTLARLLGPARAHYPRRGAPITRPGSALKHEIPIRTFSEWNEAQPGFLEVDLVAHCGSSTEGFYLCTLCAVDGAGLDAGSEPHVAWWQRLEALPLPHLAHEEQPGVPRVGPTHGGVGIRSLLIRQGEVTASDESQRRARPGHRQAERLKHRYVLAPHEKEPTGRPRSAHGCRVEAGEGVSPKPVPPRPIEPAEAPPIPTPGVVGARCRNSMRAVEALSVVCRCATIDPILSDGTDSRARPMSALCSLALFSLC